MRTIILDFLHDLVRPRRDLVLENLALRQQLLVLQRTNPKPPFNALDRLFWVLLSRWWAGWRRPLRLLKPETVIAWHRKGWRLWWRFKSRSQTVGRPKIPYEVIELIRRISRENPTWGVTFHLATPDAMTWALSSGRACRGPCSARTVTGTIRQFEWLLCGLFRPLELKPEL